MLSFEEFTDALYESGWRATCDAQHTEVVSVYDEMVSEGRKAQQIVELRQQVAILTEQNRLAVEALNEINNWLVCACIATPEDMAQSFGYMQSVADKAIAAIQDNEVKE